MTKKKHGVRAVCRVLMRFIHPSKLIRDKYPNRTEQQKLGELTAIRQEVKTVNRKPQMCIIMRHDIWPNKEVYCVKRWVKVMNEGSLILLKRPYLKKGYHLIQLTVLPNERYKCRRHCHGEESWVRC